MEKHQTLYHRQAPFQTPLLKRAAGKSLRALLVLTQVVSTLSATIVGLAQPAALELLLGTPNAAQAAVLPTTGSLTGVVFRDFDASGTRAIATEPGQAGVQVTALCVADTGSDNLAGTADDVYTSGASTTTAANGSYSFSSLPAGPCRVEFGIPATLSFLKPAVGPNYLVQFINLSGGAATVNAALNNPADYSNATLTPDLAAVVMRGGNYGDAAHANQAVLMSFPYAATGNSSYASGTARTDIATAGALGSVWGLARQRSSGTFFAGAFLRRHVNLGPTGINAIYRVASGGTVSVLTSAIDTSGGQTIPTNATRAIALDGYSVDAAVYGLVGRVGWGDLDISEDDTTLYAVNLGDRALYMLNTTSGAVIASANIPNPACTSGTYRPWGLGVNDGLVYAGVVCDNAQSAHVYAYNPGSLAVRMPNGSVLAAGAWSSDVLGDTSVTAGIDINFVRGNAGSFFAGTWRAWTYTYSPSDFSASGANAPLRLEVGPRPALSDITFDNDGSMVLAFADRATFQMGTQDNAPPDNDTANYTEFILNGGDVLRAAPPASGGTFTLENQGNVARGASLGGGTLNGLANNEGPGGGEFYFDERAVSVHAETAGGAALIVPGQTNLVMTQMDPQAHPVDFSPQPGWPAWAADFQNDSRETSGIAWHANTSFAQRTNAYTLVGPVGIAVPDHQVVSGQFGKAYSIGDIEMLADGAPIEIGNRVWYDANGNGLQDAGEAGIPGVTVTLYDSGGTTVLATVATDGQGQYRFSSANGTDATGVNYSVTQLAPGAQVVVGMPTTLALTLGSASGARTVAVGGATQAALTPQEVSASTIGSDPNRITGKTAVITLGAAGANNHTFDAGYGPPPAQFGDRVWIESDNDGLASTGTITPVAGMVIYAVSSTGVVYTTTTDAQGYYSFTVTPGTYTVTYAAAPNGTAPSATPGGSSESGNAGSYQQSGNPDQSHIIGTTVTVAANEANWHADFGFYQLPHNPPVTGAITVTKQVTGTNGTAGTFNVNVIGPNGYVSNTTVSNGSTVVFTNLLPGVYTVTEASPGAGWVITTTTSGSAITTPVTSANQAIVTLTGVITAPLVTAGAITGVVYSDFNADGNRGVGETGVQSVTVTAYDRNGNAVGSTTTLSNGSYSLTPSAAGPWRTEFTGLPVGYEPSRVFTGPSTGSGQNGTSVQFVNSAPTTNVNLGVHLPESYVDSAPRLVTTLQMNGDGSTSGETRTLISWAYSLTGDQTDANGMPDASFTTTGLKSTTGSVWGLAHARQSDQLYSAAFVRRHTGMGTLGIGGIYASPLNGAVATTASPWLDVTSLGVNLGSIASNATRGLTVPNATDTTRDPLGFAAIGKVGLGDIELSADENTLYATNVASKSLLLIDVGSRTLVQEVALPNPNCVGGSFYPFGLKVHRGSAYVGGVCNAETSGSASNLIGYIYKYTPGTGFAATPVLTIPFNYVHGPSFSNSGDVFTGTWRAWTDSFANYSCGLFNGAIYAYRPQPMIADIEFDDVDGAMIVSVVSRSNYQHGDRNGAPTATDFPTPCALLSNPGSQPTGASNFFATMVGDMLRASVTGSSYMLESNGSVGGRSSATGVGNGEGIGGGEFYNDNQLVNGAHKEMTRGGIAMRHSATGSELVGLSAYPLLSNVGATTIQNGVAKFDNIDGSRNEGVIFTSQAFAAQPVTPNGFFGKAAGLGDLELLSTPAPIEIGNRVWQDVNNNGVQDPGEPPISGVQVQLINPATGAVLQTVTTNISGTYYFTREAATGAYSQTLRANTQYSISIATGQSVLTGLTLTTKDADAISGSTNSNDNILDVRDSDGTLLGSTAQIFYTTGGVGQNNHGLDFGFSRAPTATTAITNQYTIVPTATFGNLVWVESDGDGIAATGTITPVVGKVITATASNGMVYTTTTNASGYYTFVVPANLTYTVNYGPAPAGTAPSATPQSGTVNNTNVVDQQSHPQNTQVYLVKDDVIPVVDFGFYQLPPNPPATGVLTVTKSVVGSGSGPFNISVNGPNGFISNTSIISGETKVFTNLVPGVYTVTEASPGAGWLITTTTSGSAITTPVTSGSTAIVTLTGVITAPLATAGAITGTVFNDYNSDGNIQRNATVSETGVGGVIVTAYDRNGNAVGSTTTLSNGTYSLTPSAAGPWRIEFTNLPAGYEPSRVFTGPSTGSGQNGSSTQFINSVPVSGGANFGVLKPCDYCQNSPQLQTTHMTFGDPLQSPPTAFGALVRFNYDSPAVVSNDANLTQLGAAWGLAYQRSTRKMFVGAFQRRFTGFGPLGPGGIYYLNRDTGTLVNWLDVDTLPGVNTGADPHTTLPAVGGGTPVRDPNSYDAVGKISLGDIDMSEDETTLWAMNLNQRTLLEMPLVGNPPVAPASAKAHDLSNAVSCTNGVFRPFATKFYQGQIYVGGVCSGENGGTQSNLTAHVLVHDPAGPLSSFTSVFSMPLNYGKGCSLNFGGFVDCNGWNVWQTNWPSSFDAGGGGYSSKTQPMLSDIEFDVDGSMILGFADRWGYQTGNANYQPNAPDAALYSGATGGDMLRICLISGSFVAEGGAGCPKQNADYLNPFRDPDVFEYYEDLGGGGSHPEAMLGSMALLPGRGEVASTKLDPQTVFAVGVSWLDSATGDSVKEFNTMGNPYNKAAAMGDLELICDIAPIEIGNRVWQDVNNNGVQDPGEPTIAGVQVQLIDPATGAVLQTTTTNISGTYYFTREAATGNYSTTLRPNTQYSISIATGQTALNGYTLTTKDTQAISGATNSNDNMLDVRDSDGTLLGSTAQIFYTTGGFGQNNHGLDFGFTRNPTATVVITNTAPAAITVVKYTNGFDADTVTGPYLRVGQVVTWSYVITNSGNSVLTNIALGDDQQGSVSCPQTTLAAGASMTCVLTGVAMAGQYTNTAVVTGTPPSGTPVTSTNPSHYFGYTPSVVVRKYTNGFDADTITGPFIKVGDPVTWTYIATNTGNVVLNVAAGELRDDVIGAVNGGAFTLQPGETSTFTRTGIAISGQYTNTGLITGTPLLPPGTPITPELPGFPPAPPITNPVTSTNPSHYFGANPSIVLKKLTNGYDADALPLTCNGAPTFNNQACVPLGSAVTWTYVVTNTGNLTMSVGVGELRDDMEGPINASAFSLAPGASTTLTKTGIAQVGQYTNTGVVTGTPVLPPGVPITPELPGFPPSTPVTNPITSTNPSHYFGDSAGLGDFVWEDLDHDGQQDPNEPAVPGVLVTLRTSTTTLTTTSTITGYYAFTNLVPGLPYTVSFGVPAGYTWTLPTVGNPISDSNVIDNAGNTTQVVLGSNEFNPTIDAGVWRPASLGDYVWEDINHDGQQNDGPTGVNGVTVTLYSNGVPVSQTQTYTFGGLPGYYTFTNLISATYSVTFQAPAEYQFTQADLGADGTDSDANAVTSATGSYVLNAGESIPTVDAGIWRPASLGDYVWEDLNHDGQQNDGPTGINGVAVALLDVNGNVVSTTTTYQGGPSNANGYYTFTNLISGTYSVSFTLPSGYTWTLPNVGNDATDSDGVPNGNVAVTGPYVLNAGQSIPTVDQGVWRPASLGDLVWYDQNHDGVQQPNEPGVPGVVVTLQTSTSTLTATTTSTGHYSFTNLISGVPYTVTFGQPPTGYTFTLPTVGSPISDSNVLNPSGVTAPVVLQPGENNPTIDAGVWVPMALGNVVWIDTNNDGINNEPASNGVPNVTMVLYTDNGDNVLGVGDTQVATTTTDASGHYTFTNLISGTYLVQIPQSNFAGPLANYQNSTGNGVATTNNNTNNDDDGEPAGALGVTSRPITLTPFAEPTNDDTDDGLTPNTNSNYSVDFGFFQTAAIGDRVWYDVNANGVQDGAEITGVPGVQVSLYGPTNTVIATTTTDANGYYSFTNLSPGDYSVGFALPSGYTRSPSTAGGASDPTDSDADMITGRTNTTTLVSGEYDPTWDAGIYQTASLGDRVWEDLNRNGVQDGGEPGVMSVTVTLWQNGVPISTTQTDGTGFYGFANLTPTVPFSVSFGLPSGYNFTQADVGADGTDSDADPVTGGTPTVVLQPNESNPTIDAGIWRPAGIGDRVWLDNDRDGVQNAGAGETGVPNVPVTLWQNGNPISNTQTNAQGYYSFTGLIPGAYSLTFGLPAGYARTPQDALGNGLDAQDSDTTLLTGQTITTTLDSNEYDPTWDMGIFQLASLGDKVWEDLDHDGVQDPADANGNGTEPGVPSVTVVLYDVNNVPVMTTTTDANGNYSFTNLIPAIYTVGFVPPPTYLVTTQGSNPASNNPTDSNADPTTGRTPPVGLVPGQNNPTIDAGLWRPASLGDFVWEDIDHDGQQDAGEPGLNGVMVTLLDNGGNVISTTQTYSFGGQDGYYTFTNLISGTYVVSFSLPMGYQWTQTNVGADGTDSDGVPNGSIAVTAPYVLNAGESIPTVDQGVWRPASLGDRVWWDYDRNGQQATQTDVGVPNVTVRLLDASGAVISTTVTDASGFYTFSNLISSTYRVAFDTTTLPAGAKVTLPNVTGNGKDLFDSDADPISGQTQLIPLAPGEHDPSWDLGIWLPAGLGDVVWHDLNRDGVQGPNEPGVPGVTVILYDNAGNVVSTTTTNASGYYIFSNLVPMTYTVGFVPPGSFTLTIPFVGNPGTDSNAGPDGRTPPVVLAPGQFNPTIDAGLWIPASLGNYVWRDDDRDGLQDPNEAGVPGVRVNLLNAEGVVIRTTTTDEFGYYLFTNLIPGDYAVQFVPPAGTVLTQANDEADVTDTKDSDANAVTGRTITTTLVSGENDPTWDAGIVYLAGLGDYVWSDTDRDGTQDGNEAPVPGVVVTLYDSNGTPISTTKTDVNGFYVFTGLLPGTYSVGFTAPNGFMFTTPGVTPSSNTDSNANPQTGRTAPVTLLPGEYNPTIDAGFVPLASLGDFVWNDRDRDGVQDPGEPGVPGVTVVLKNGDGQTVATTTTDASGAYSFTNLIPGTYVVVFTIPQGYTFTKTDVGADGTDSDATPTQDVLIGVTPPVTLQPGENNPTIDAGVWVPARLGDFVWYDVNRNGIQDAGEVGVPGITVTLYQRGSPISTTVTTDGGRYLFDNLIPGDYYVVFTLPNGFTFTMPSTGGAQSDSNADPLTGQSTTTTIEPGEDDRTWDAGIWLPLPALNIRKTAHTSSAAVKQGDLVSYTIVVSNSGAGIANNVVITDPLPSSLVYEPGSAKPAALYANRTLTWTKATLRPGERYTMTFMARVQTVSNPNATQIVNLAYTSATGPANVPVMIATPPLRADDQANVPLAPSFVTLSSFTARWVTNTVAVNWVTGVEVDTFGFALLRAQGNDIGAAVKLNSVLIPARGTNGGASYDFVDSTVDTSRSDIVYYYWLQETETSGRINTYGPVKAERAAPKIPTKYVMFLPMVSKGKSP